MIIIRIDKESAVLLLLGVAVLAVYTIQAMGLAADLWELTRSIHFTLVQAPLEAALNSGQDGAGV